MPELITDDGLTLQFTEWGAEHRGKAPTVVLHHGFAANAVANWESPGITDALVDAGRHLVAIDARGHGRSATPHDPALYGEPRMAKDLRLLIDDLGADELYLVGYSMGAIVSLIAASQDPRITRLVVGGIGAGVVEAEGRERRAAAREGLAHALTTPDPSTVPPRARGFRTMAEVTKSDRDALAAVILGGSSEPVDVGAITARTLVLVGTEDDLAERPEVLADAVPGASLELVSGNHLSCLRNPSFTAALVDFLES